MHSMRDSIFSDHDFYNTLLRLAIPIATQQLVMNALNAVDVLMVGQLGETAVAAVGLAGQVFFLMTLFLFGVGSGAAIFSAQFWGRGDLANVRRILGLALILAVSGSALFSLVAILAPAWVLSIYTHDPAVIAEGSPYLRVVGLCYVPTAISVTYAIILRSTRQVKVPMVVSVSALSLKTILAYILIFGYFGAPAMGIMGAAVATVVARFVECIAMLTITYWRKLPAAAKLAEMLDINRALVGRFLRTATPVILGEIMWSLGITIYTGIYARIGTGPLAAVSIASTIEGVAIVPFIAMANAAAIMLGNRIGADKITDAMDYAWRFIIPERRRWGGDGDPHPDHPRRVDVPVSHIAGSADRSVGGVGRHCDHALVQGRQPGDDRRGDAQRWATRASPSWPTSDRCGCSASRSHC